MEQTERYIQGIARLCVTDVYDARDKLRLNQGVCTYSEEIRWRNAYNLRRKGESKEQKSMPLVSCFVETKARPRWNDIIPGCGVFTVGRRKQKGKAEETRGKRMNPKSFKNENATNKSQRFIILLLPLRA